VPGTGAEPWPGWPLVALKGKRQVEVPCERQHLSCRQQCADIVLPQSASHYSRSAANVVRSPYLSRAPMRYLHRFPMQPLRGLPGRAGSTSSPTSRINGVQIPVVIGADLRAMADWLPPQAQRISDISCVGWFGPRWPSYLTRHSFAKIVERQPTLEDLSYPARHWDEHGVQSTIQCMGGWRSMSCWCGFPAGCACDRSGPKVPSGKGFSADGADDNGAAKPQGAGVDRQGLPGSIAPR
jgi:hypothetical protein